jgi:hypothetical protein
MAFMQCGADQNIKRIDIHSGVVFETHSSNGRATFRNGYESVTDLYLHGAHTLNDVDDIAMDLFGRSTNITVHQIME